MREYRIEYTANGIQIRISDKKKVDDSQLELIFDF
jgi:hypothetical protein